MNVLIIGASSGIGKETAYVFSRNGWDVICCARDETELHRLTGDLEIRYGGKIDAIPVDLADPSSIRRFVDGLYETHADIDCVVVTAGTLPINEDDYANDGELIRTTMTNYIGIALVINAISHRMAERKAGIIICLSSVAGDRGRGKNFIYGASKSALTTYLQGLRMRLYPEGVRVVTVVPGYVDTLMSYGKIKKGLAVTPQYVASKIFNLLESSSDVTYIPPIWWFVMKVIRLVPEKIFKKIGSNF